MNLIESLPLPLQAALKETPGGDKPQIVALGGDYGQGIVATDDQLFVLKSESGAAAAKCMAFSLRELSRVTASEKDGKALFAVEGAEGAFITMPSFYLDKFTAAAAAINARIGGEVLPPAAAQPTAAPVAVPTGDRCPACSAPIRPNHLFCAQCGVQIGILCASCGGALSPDAKYCSWCGKSAKPMELDCRACGARVTPQRSGFCPQCGALLTARCAGCGGALQDEWIVCPTCGRRLGSTQGLPTRANAQIDRVNALVGEEPAAPSPEPVVAPPPSGDAEAFNQAGVGHYEAERYDEAIAAFRDAVRLDPGNSQYRCNLAVALGEDGQEEESFAEFQKVLTANPNDVTALLNLGYMFSERERYEEARTAWEKVVNLSPDSPEGQEAKENLRNLSNL